MTKKLKATLSMLLCAMMVLCSVAVGGMVVSAETVSGTCGDNLTWTFDTATGELIISGTSGMKYYGDASNYPWHSYRSSITKLTIGDNVTSISRYAFEDCKALEEIVIPDKVETIGNYAFSGCEKLKKITIGSGVTSIDRYAFSDCKALEELVIPDKVETIGFGTFSGCENLKKVTIGSGVTSIDSYAFSDCKALEEIVIPDKVEKVATFAFLGCKKLKKVTIGRGVTSIGVGVFGDCNDLEEITVDACNTNYLSEDGVLFNKDKTKLIKYPPAKSDKSFSIPQTVTEIEDPIFRSCKFLEEITVDVSNTNYSSEDGVLFNKDKTVLIKYPPAKSDKSYSIPQTVTKIKEYAFENCKSLEEIVISDNVETIGSYAFYGCENLKKVTIGSGVTSIGSYVFKDSNVLEEIAVDVSNTSYSSEDGVLFNKDKTHLIKYPPAKADKSFSIPQTVTEIYIYFSAFDNCKFLEEITVDPNNTSYSCEDGVLFNKDKTRLIKYPQAKADKSYSIPQTVTEIQEYAFDNCKLLEKITVGNVIESIGEGTFYDCKALEEIVISKSVTTVYLDAFDGCDNLKYVFYAGSQEDWSSIDAWGNNEKLNDAVIHYNATGHTLAEGKCTVTGCDYVCDHEESTDKPTCEKSAVCSECGATLPATGHTYSEWKVTKSATFFKDGVKTRTCVNEGCTETETRVVLSKFSEFKSGLFGVDFLKAILTVFADLLTSVC